LPPQSHRERKGSSHAQNEDQKWRSEALQGPRKWIKRGQAFKRHILTKKTTKSKRQLRGSAPVAKADVKSIRSMMPYA